jgi:hypothetical protein
MKNLKGALLLTVLIMAWIVPEIASSAYVVCRRQANRGCYICSDYFHANSEDEAAKRCAKLRSRAYLFRSIGGVAAWKLGNCTCEEEDSAPGK